MSRVHENNLDGDDFGRFLELTRRDVVVQAAVKMADTAKSKTVVTTGVVVATICACIVVHFISRRWQWIRPGPLTMAIVAFALSADLSTAVLSWTTSMLAAVVTLWMTRKVRAWNKRQVVRFRTRMWPPVATILVIGWLGEFLEAVPRGVSGVVKFCTYPMSRACRWYSRWFSQNAFHALCLTTLAFCATTVAITYALCPVDCVFVRFDGFPKGDAFAWRCSGPRNGATAVCRSAPESLGRFYTTVTRLRFAFFPTESKLYT